MLMVKRGISYCFSGTDMLAIKKGVSVPEVLLVPSACARRRAVSAALSASWRGRSVPSLARAAGSSPCL